MHIFWLHIYWIVLVLVSGRRRRDHMVVGFTTTYAISAYHHWCCEFESRSGRGVQHSVIKFVSDLRQVCGFLWDLPPVSSTNKTDCHDITEILLKVALSTIKPTNQPVPVFWFFWYTFTKTCILKKFVIFNICLFNKCKKWQQTSFSHTYNILVLAGHVLCPSTSLKDTDVSCYIALIVLWGS